MLRPSAVLPCILRYDNKAAPWTAASRYVLILARLVLERDPGFFLHY